MGAQRYKAFISYGHEDEEWARWLHRALESFRVPKAIRGRDAPIGRVEARIAPVFRDRDELSLSDDLGQELAQALEDSATLIVLCSPAIARSRWADEEVRRFKALGRRDRIFCVLVDGDPERENCFPPSLLDDSDPEPLFADPRKGGDGKRLARQKIIAGLLGVPLDEIRQRDRVRQRKWTAAALLAASVAFVLAFQAYSARQAEDRERERAEQLALFIVEIGDRLQAEVDLETMSLIAGEAMEQLVRIDQSRLPPETRASVALALRQVGFVHEGQGEPVAALEAYTESRDIFGDLSQQHAELDEYFFELSQAEFYLGEFHRLRGEYVDAEPPMRSYERIALERYEEDPNDAGRLLELSYSTGNILALQISAGVPVDEELLERSDEAVRLARASLEAGGDDAELLAHLSMTLAWAADAQLGACRLPDALAYRQQNLEYAQAALERSPTSMQRELDLALAHSGLAMVNHFLGNLDEALRHRAENVRRMRVLLTDDQSNFQLESETVYREFQLAKLLADIGDDAEALEGFDAVESWYRPRIERDGLSAITRLDYADFLVTRADFAIRFGDVSNARSLLLEADGVLNVEEEELKSARVAKRLRAKIEWVWWQMTGTMRNPTGDQRLTTLQIGNEANSDCLDAELAAQAAVMSGRPELGREPAGYLVSRGYAYPEFQRFCAEYGPCPASGGNG